MGTRHLTLVVLNKEYKVAQYGQWDGYPEGQGKTVLEFLKKGNPELFRDKVSKLQFRTEEDFVEFDRHVKANQLQDTWPSLYPHLSRDTGAGILKIIQDSPDGLKLRNELEFAAESLMCEWAYLIDLDKNVLEVYSGFNKVSLTRKDRFYKLALPDNSNGYFQIKMIASYPFADLPTLRKMKSECKRLTSYEDG